MPILEDRTHNIMDGTYVNAPDMHAVQPSRQIGLREFNNNVLVHNWFEERIPFEKKEYPKTSTYTLDYKPFPDAKPDVVLRKRLIASAEGHGTKNLVGMHNFDSSRNYITLYDEHINRRARPPPLVPVGQQFPEQRQWKIANDCWIPEKSDYPLQGEPTKWGLREARAAKQASLEEKFRNRRPNLSEYTDKYERPSRESYTNARTMGVPKEISASFNDINRKLGEMPKTRSTSSSIREPQARDVTDSVYAGLLTQSRKHPRTYYYLGKIPTDGSLNAFSMRNYETLTPAREPTSLFKN